MATRLKSRRGRRRDPRERLALAAEAGLVALLAVASAQVIWTLASPPGPLGDWRADATATPAAPPPGAFDPFTRASAEPDAPEVSTLALALYGVRQDRATGRGSAIIGPPGGEQRSYLVGEEVAAGTVLAGVEFDNVILEQGGERTRLYLDQSLPATAASAAPATPAAAAGPAPAAPAAPTMPAVAAGTPPRPLLTGIEVTPRLAGGRVAGYVLAPSGSGDAFRAAGFQPGDVLVAVAGRPVASLGSTQQLERELEGTTEAVVEVERDGKPVTLRVRR